MTVYRTIWIRPADLEPFQRKEPLLPSGVRSSQELEELRAAAVRSFGSLRRAALHHLTGAFGTEPNVQGKPAHRGVAHRQPIDWRRDRRTRRHKN